MFVGVLLSLFDFVSMFVWICICSSSDICLILCLFEFMRVKEFMYVWIFLRWYVSLWICVWIFWIFLKVCLFESNWSIIFLNLFKSRSRILNLNLSLSLDVQLRFKKLWRFVYICLSVPYLKWMSNIYPLSIMFLLCIILQFWVWTCVSYVYCMSIMLNFYVICMPNVHCICLRSVFNS